MYKIPNKMKVKFLEHQLEGLYDRMFRIIWCAISVDHIRDQYFSLEVYEFVIKLKKKWPLRPAEFICFVMRSELNKFGKSHSGKIDINWWLKVWELLYYNKDIKIIYDVDD